MDLIKSIIMYHVNEPAKVANNSGHGAAFADTNYSHSPQRKALYPDDTSHSSPIKASFNVNNVTSLCLEPSFEIYHTKVDFVKDDPIETEEEIIESERETIFTEVGVPTN